MAKYISEAWRRMSWSVTGEILGLVMPKNPGNRSEPIQLGLIVSPKIIMFWRMAPWFATDGGGHV
jgi:hypothetical protein